MVGREQGVRGERGRERGGMGRGEEREKQGARRVAGGCAYDEERGALRRRLVCVSWDMGAGLGVVRAGKVRVAGVGKR